MPSCVLHRLIAILALVLIYQPAAAQFSGMHVPDGPAPGSTINVAATWDGRHSLDGVDVQLGPGMRLVDVRVLRFGRDAIPTSWTMGDITHRIVLEDARALPHEIILTVELPESSFPLDWRITPLRDDDGVLSPSIAYEQQGTIPLVSVRENPDDLSLDLGSSAPVLLRSDRLPAITYEAPFEIGFWIRTTGLDEVVLSTWNGDEKAAYPIEIVIGPGGRLAVFRGRGGMHESLSSRNPVADGAWHEVRVEFDGERLLLTVDGAGVDSLDTSYSARAVQQPMLALGDRIPNGDASSRTFSGWIDDLMIRSDNGDAALYATSAPDQVMLSFDSEIDPSLLARESARTVFTQSYRAQTLPPGSLRAQLLGSALQLTWEGSADMGGTFLIERSEDRRYFDQIGVVEIADTDDAAATFEFMDGNAGSGVQYYRVIHELPDGNRLTSRSMKAGLAPAEQESVELIGNFPNPFSSSTTIAYRLAQSRDVELSVWDLSGQRLATLVSGVVSEGRHEVLFQADDLPSGTYFLRLQTPNRSVSRKMILTR